MSQRGVVRSRIRRPDPPKSGQRDVFIQLDHVVDSNGDFTPNPDALTLVQNAFLATTSTCTSIPKYDPTGARYPTASMQRHHRAAASALPYPNHRSLLPGRLFISQNLPLNYPDETSCEPDSSRRTPGSGPACIRRFHPRRRIVIAMSFSGMP